MVRNHGSHRQRPQDVTPKASLSVAQVHERTYTETVSFEWDPAKAELNRRKHGIDFADAVSVLEDESALTLEDLAAEFEQRWITLGRDSLGRFLVVVYTWRGTRIRLISARPATARERRQYEEGA